MDFQSDVASNAGGGMRTYSELRQVLQEIGLPADEDDGGALWTNYTPGSYEPIRVKLHFPDSLGILALEGQLLALPDHAVEELRVALNYLNVEVGTFRFYVGMHSDGQYVLVRHDLLPNLEQDPSIHPRELRQALTGLCAHKAIFSETLQQVQMGRSWRFVKDALRALR